MEDATMTDLACDGEEYDPVMLDVRVRGGKREAKAATKPEKELGRLIKEYPLSIGRYVALQWNFNREFDTDYTYDNPAVIIGELARSAAKGPNNHRIWRDLMATTQSITAWKAGHATWRQARQKARMSRLPTFMQLQALRYLDPTTEDMPQHLVTAFSGIDLDWFLFDKRPAAFWRDAQLEDPGWRDRHMTGSDSPWPKLDSAPTEDEANKVRQLMRAVFPRKPAGIDMYIKSEPSSEADEHAKSEASVATHTAVSQPEDHGESEQTKSTSISPAIQTLQSALENKITSAQTASKLLKELSDHLLRLNDKVSEQNTVTAQIREKLRQADDRIRQLEAQASGPGPEEWASWQQRITHLEWANKRAHEAVAALQQKYDRQQQRIENLLRTWRETPPPSSPPLQPGDGR